MKAKMFVIMKGYVPALAPGLTAKKVFVRGTRGRAGYPATRYVREVEKIPALSAEQEHDLAVRYAQSHDMDARNKLVEANLGLVVKMARKAAHDYAASGAKFDDLVQEGTKGLMHAIDKFDPSRGFRLSTYAQNWIGDSMETHISTLWKEPGAEIGEGIASKEGMKGGETEYEPQTVIAQARSYDPTAEEELERKETESQIEQAMKKLSEREVYVIRARILTEEPKTLEEVGAELGLTKMRIKQIETEALGKMRIEMGKSFWLMLQFFEDLQKSFKLAAFHGMAEKETARKEKEESGNWSQRDLRMKRLARRRKEEVAPPSW